MQKSHESGTDDEAILSELGISSLDAVDDAGKRLGHAGFFRRYGVVFKDTLRGRHHIRTESAGSYVVLTWKYFLQGIEVLAVLSLS